MDVTQPILEWFSGQFPNWAVPLLIVGLLAYGYAKKVKVYEAFTEGAKDGFSTALRIIPYLVAIMVAVGMFRASGAMDLVGQALAPVLGPLGIPQEALMMGLIRPLSGSGAYGLMTETIKAAGPDSWTGVLVSTIQGSTETTLYVLAVYFGSVQIRESRHALPAGLGADLAGFVASIVICRLTFSALAP